MRRRAWFDQCREHVPLPPELYTKCPVCSRCPCACIPEYYHRLDCWSPFPSDRVTPRGCDDERMFFSAITANMIEATPRLAFADWLDEHGRTDEAAILRDRWASPVITPFRVLPYWRKAPIFERLLRQWSGDPEVLILTRRLQIHDETHGPGVRVKVIESFTRVLLLDDADAARAGIDRWPLLPREVEPIIRVRSTELPTRR